ncbi:TPA: hypothetical protein ACNIQM_000722 [Citrobacter werkmanii]
MNNELTRAILIGQCTANIETLELSVKNGGSDTPHLVARDLEINRIALAALETDPKKYNIGESTMRHVFTPAGITNISDLQAVFDQIETALSRLESGGVVWMGIDPAKGYAAPQPAPDSEAQATLQRLAVILHGSDTDLNLLTVTAQSLVDRCKNLSRERDALPDQSSDEVNAAAWKLHDMLTEYGPLTGHQFNNLKGCFYEALKVAMRNLEHKGD